MGNTTRSGLKTHDATPAAFGALGRRGDQAAKQKARRMMHAGPEPDHKPFGSSNHHKIQALNNAVVYGSYDLALSWHKNMRKHGLAEGGPLYGCAGNFGYSAALLACALRDGRDDIAELEREALAWYRDYAREIAIDRPRSITAILPDGKTDSDNRMIQGGPEGQVFMGGSRAAFSGIGWYYEAQATNLYQWLVDTSGRELSPRLAGYEPRNVTNCWDSWVWIAAMLLDLIPAKASAQPQTLARAFRTTSLPELFDGIGAAGPLKCKWRTEVIRFSDGSAFWTTDRKTASPKPPASVIEYGANGSLKIYIPDGYKNYGCTGRGSVEWSNRNVWGVAVADGEQPDRTTVRSRSEIVSHRVYPARGKGWRDGRFHPKETPVPPGPGPEPEKPDDDESWLERHKWQAAAGVIFLVAVVGALRGCW